MQYHDSQGFRYLSPCRIRSIHRTHGTPSRISWQAAVPVLATTSSEPSDLQLHNTPGGLGFWGWDIREHFGDMGDMKIPRAARSLVHSIFSGVNLQIQ